MSEKVAKSIEIDFISVKGGPVKHVSWINGGVGYTQDQLDKALERIKALPHKTLNVEIIR